MAPRRIDSLERLRELPAPHLVYLGDVSAAADAKTGLGLRDWVPERCIGEFACHGNAFTLGLPRLDPAAARARGARSAVIGVAPVGGRIAQAWIPDLVRALQAGLDLVSGMHTSLADVPELRAAAAICGRELIDVRRPPAGLPTGTGRKRTGKRLLAVGTDCALGKKYTALALARAFRLRGVPSDFRATGQTGLLIAGSGIAIDAVVADFVAGAAELLSPDAPADHWDVIEGQGSLSHPAYAGVALGLLHGSQPDVLVVCHDPDRATMNGFPGFALPGVQETIELNLLLARRTNPAVRCAGISVNTSARAEADALAAMDRIATQLGLPVADPIRGGSRFEALVSACLADPRS
jgi:uncharacterized NAD-dependent epimerase/dehydratase family protein